MTGGATALVSLLPGPGELAMFATAVLLLNATPGVDLLLTVTRTLRGGMRAGMAAAVGINAGCVVHALAAAFGLAAVLALHPGTFRVIQWAGAAYLVWLGVGMLRDARRPAATGPRARNAIDRPAGQPRDDWWSDVRAGLFTNVLNPKVALFFLAFLPQFVPAASSNKTASFLLLGAWFVVQSLAFLMLLVALAAQARHLQVPTLLIRALQAAGGLTFVALAVRLVREQPTGVT